ncbi:MAG: hypothetical protein ACRETD_06975 [Steroidobacteraceae bacterium]
MTRRTPSVSLRTPSRRTYVASPCTTPDTTQPTYEL